MRYERISNYTIYIWLEVVDTIRMISREKMTVLSDRNKKKIWFIDRNCIIRSTDWWHNLHRIIKIVDSWQVNANN